MLAALVTPLILLVTGSWESSLPVVCCVCDCCCLWTEINANVQGNNNKKRNSHPPAPPLLEATCQSTQTASNERHVDGEVIFYLNKCDFLAFMGQLLLRSYFQRCLQTKVIQCCKKRFKNTIVSKRKNTSSVHRDATYLTLPDWEVLQMNARYTAEDSNWSVSLQRCHMSHLCLSQYIWDWPRSFCNSAHKDPSLGNIYQYQIALRKVFSTDAFNRGLKDLSEMRPKNLSQRPL